MTKPFEPCRECRLGSTLTSYPPQYRWICDRCGGGITDSPYKPPSVIPPTSGRIVRYVETAADGPGGEWPAIVTVVHTDGTVCLQVFGRNAVYAAWNIPQATEPTPGHWHWPITTGVRR